MIHQADERAIWLARNVLPYEAELRCWLRSRMERSLRSSVDLDDVVQESYSRFMLLDDVDHIRNCRTYLFEVAKSIVRDHLRSAAVIRISDVPDLDALRTDDYEPSAETIASDREELQLLAEAIAALPEPTRTVFWHRRVNQTSQREIALNLGMAESTVEKHVMRGIAYMVERFGRGGRRRIQPSNEGSAAKRDVHAQGDGTRS